MSNYCKIKLFQDWPAYLNKKVGCVRRFFSGKGDEAIRFIESIDHFETSRKKDRRALVVMRPQAWLTAVSQFPNITLYNNSGFIYGLIKGLNLNGFKVDLIAENIPFEVTNKYDLLVAHGGGCRPLIEQLQPEITVIQYISGLYWEVFEKESNERYDRFFRKYGGERPEFHRRSISGMTEGLTFLNKRADFMFTINCPRMIAAYGEYSSKFHFTGLGAYLDPLFNLVEQEKDFDKGRKNFIYVGGTGGNLQKGLDILIEAFAANPDLNLYIYCKVEEEILKYCRKELELPNIHYIYHWRYKPFHKKLTSLLKKTNFSVHAPINIGMGTAFMGTLGEGMIPVGYVDVVDPGESAVLTDDWAVSSISDCVREASEKSADWCASASKLTLDKYNEFCEPDQVSENFRLMFEKLVPDTID